MHLPSSGDHREFQAFLTGGAACCAGSGPIVQSPGMTSLCVNGCPGGVNRWPTSSRGEVGRKARKGWPRTSPVREGRPLLPAPQRAHIGASFPLSASHCIYCHIKQLSTSVGDVGVKVEGKGLGFAFNRTRTETGGKSFFWTKLETTLRRLQK